MYREDEKLCLKWNDFKENAISAFGTLREDREFADVTLVCEDGQQVEAHKVILASSSPFFLNLLRRNKHPHPLVYMRGVKSEDLVAMIDFLYYGQANVYQDNLDSFLAVAGDLQLKGLMGSGAEKEAEKEAEKLHNTPTIKNKSPEQVAQSNFIKQEVQTPDPLSYEDKVETTRSLEGTVAVTDYTVTADLQDLDDKIKSMMEVSENLSSNNSRGRFCKVCGKEGQIGNIMKHIEINHITGVSHTCDICGTVTRSRPAMAQHKQRNHTEN